MDPNEFNMYDVLRAAGTPAGEDVRGGVHLAWPLTGVLMIAPRRGRAACDLALVKRTLVETPKGLRAAARFVHRHFPEVTTRQAMLAAGSMRVLAEARVRSSEVPPAAEAELALLVEHVAFDADGIPAAAQAFLTEDAAGATHASATDALHRNALAGVLAAGEVTGGRGRLRVEFPDQIVSVADGQSSELVHLVYQGISDREEDLTRGHALLAVALEEGIVHVTAAMARTPADVTRLERKYVRLLALRERIFRNGVDVAEGFEDLAARFEYSLRWPSGGMPHSALVAHAMLAMRSWTARRGRSAAGRSIDMERLAEIAGIEPEVRGDEHVFRFGVAGIVVSSQGDLATGHGVILAEDAEVSTARVALPAVTVEQALWAAAAVDSLGVSTPPALARYGVRAVVNPWFDASAQTPQLLTRLGRAAKRLGQRSAAQKLVEVLERCPFAPRI